MLCFPLQNFTSYASDYDVDNATLSTVLNNLKKWSHYSIWLSANIAFGNGKQTSETVEVHTDQDSM